MPWKSNIQSTLWKTHGERELSYCLLKVTNWDIKKTLQGLQHEPNFRGIYRVLSRFTVVFQKPRKCSRRKVAYSMYKDGQVEFIMRKTYCAHNTKNKNLRLLRRPYMTDTTVLSGQLKYCICMYPSPSTHRNTG